MKQKIIALLCAAVFLSCSFSSAYASPEGVHNRYMRQVLFGEDFNITDYNEKERQSIEALEAASYLAIDQDNGKGTDRLKTLYDYGVSSLPPSICEINFQAGSDHRLYTHLGWHGANNDDTHPYDKDIANWNVRKTILVQTIAKVFGFKNEQRGLNAVINYVQKMFGFKSEQRDLSDSLSAVIYYVHILGDHIHYENVGGSNTGLLPVGGELNEYDIIHQLIHHFDCLFNSSSSSFQYNSFRSQLVLFNSRFSNPANREGGENFAEGHNAKDLMDLLIQHVPGLLREESYFSKAFPLR